MSVKQDIQVLKAVFDTLAPEEKTQVMAAVGQLGIIANLVDKHDGVGGALFGVMMGAKLRPERTKAEFAAVFGVSL
jgi:hypothetical protein